MIVGEIMALLSALLWAVAVLAFERAGKRFTPWQLNVFKGVTSVLLFSLTALVIGLQPWREVTASDATRLALSGLIGITLGDTAYFAALQRLGTRRCLLLGILSPPLTALLGWLALHETLTLREGMGIALTLGGVAWVIAQKQADDTPRQVWLGIAYGTLAVGGQAVGALLTRSVFAAHDVSPLTTALFRLGAATLALGAGSLLMRPGTSKPEVAFWRDKGVHMAAVGTLLGTYIAMITYMSALKYASSVGVVQTLLTTSQLWGLGLAALRGERLSTRAIVGAFVGLAGVALLLL